MATHVSSDGLDRTLPEEFEGNQWIEYLRGKYQGSVDVILHNFGHGHLLEDANGLEQKAED